MGTAPRQTDADAPPGDDTVAFDDTDDRSAAMTDTITEWVEDIADAADQARTSEAFQEWLDVQASFHDYSWRNTLLIKQQLPEATKVAGYKAWQDLGRQVQEGESAIWIWAPIITQQCPECGNSPSYHDHAHVDCTEHEDGEPDAWSKGVVGFKPAPVFDISQTEGEPLPDIDREARGQADDLPDALIAAAEALGMQVTVVPPDQWAHGEAKGVMERHDPMTCGPVIEVRDRENNADLARTLAHEIAHGDLHYDLGAEDPDRPGRELEAETAAYVVCRHFGIDAENSKFYLAAWSEDAPEAIRERLQRITTTAKQIITTAEEVLEDGR